MVSASNLVLASASPRRAELLRQIGVKFTVNAADIDESRKPNESATDYVSRLALEKAQACYESLAEKACVLGADTTVVVDSQTLGKPNNKLDAIKMLSLLSGRDHSVFTGVALVSKGQAEVRLCQTTVCFKPLSDLIIERYWDTGEPKGKAGSYAIQGKGAVFIEKIIGSYSNVVGLPLSETSEMLASHNIPWWSEE